MGPGAVDLPAGFVLDDLPEGFVLDGDVRPAGKAERKVGTGETIVRNVAQGITFNTADEISSGIGAVYDLATGKKGFKEAYNDRVNAARAQDSEIARQRPVLSTISQAAGGVATLPIGGGAKIAATAAKAAPLSALKRLAGSKVAATAAEGATYGALSGLGAGENLADRLDKAKTGAAIGAVTGAATQGVANAVGKTASATVKGAKNIKTGVAARGQEQLAEATAALKQSGSAAYKAAREAGGTIPNETAKKMLSTIEQAAVSDGKLHPKLHRDTLGAIEDLRALVERGSVGLDDLDQTRQLLGRVIFDNTDAIKGANTDAHRAGTLLEKLDDVVEGLDGNPQWRTAREEWKKYRQFETVANAVAKGDGDPARIKRHMNTLLANKRKTRGFSPETMNALREAAKMSGGEGLLKVAGSFGFDTTGVLRNALGLGAVSMGGAPGIGLALGGTAARQVEKLVGRGKAENLLRMIEGGQGVQAVRDLANDVGQSRARQAINAMLAGAKDGQAKTILQQVQSALDEPMATPTASQPRIGKVN